MVLKISLPVIAADEGLKWIARNYIECKLAIFNVCGLQRYCRFCLNAASQLENIPWWGKNILRGANERLGGGQNILTIIK